LNGQTVPVPAHHLKIGFKSVFQKDQRSGPTGHTDHGGLIVRDIDGVHDAFQVIPLFNQVLHVGALRRSAFTGKSEMTSTQHLLQIASCFELAHFTSSSLIIFLGPPSRAVVQFLGGLN